MQTPTSAHTSSQPSSSSRRGSLHSILLQLDRKIGQISELKGQITQRMYIQQLEQSNHKLLFRKSICQNKNTNAYQTIKLFVKYFRDQWGAQIVSNMDQFQKKNMENVMSIVNFYEKQIKKCKGFYQSQIWDLREQIKRQYKVIAMMKQQVQDLMVLMKYKQSQQLNMEQEGDQTISINQRNDTAQNRETKNLTKDNELRLVGLQNRLLSHQLDIIQQQTERTMQSSQRSESPQNQGEVKVNFIKIQQKQDQQQLQKEQIKKYQQDNTNKSQCKDLDLKVQVNLEQYCQDLTPKQSQRHDPNQTKGFEKVVKKLQNNYTSSDQSQSIQQIYYHSKPIYEEQIGTVSRSNKMHTAPSDDRKIDHLQSIFFLDEEPQYLNKTAKLYNYEKHKSSQPDCQSRNHPVSNSSQFSYSGEDQYSLNQQRNLDFNKNKAYRIYNVTQKLSECQDQKSIDTQFNKKENKKIEETFTKNKNHTKNYVKNEKITDLTQQQTKQYIFKKFTKAVQINQFKSSSSMPLFSSSQPLGQLSLNVQPQRMSSRNSMENKPKTKQFLQQFRKTFSKCLNSMQVSKKNSTKIVMNSTNQNCKQTCSRNSSTQGHHHDNQVSNTLISGVMTFGKGNSSSSSSNYSSLSQKQYKQNLSKQSKNTDTDAKQLKAVDHMLKQLENNNKFIIGGKKLQLKYEGDKKNNTRNGNGILYYSNGLCYQGQFREGLRHGYGVLKLNHIQIYNGDWINDQIQGQGKIRNCAIINNRKTIYSTQSPLGKWISYNGDFKNSKFQGSGTLYLQGGQKFVGKFSQGYANGEGSIYRKNGQEQHGIWHNNILVERVFQK